MADGSLLTDLAVQARKFPLLYLLYGYLRRARFELRMLVATFRYYLFEKKTEAGQAVPPPRLRYWVHGDIRRETFLVAGINAFADIYSLIERYGGFPEGRCRLLDFGCGCGRVTRYFLEQKRDFEIWATDIDNECIQWNKEHLSSRVNWQLNNDHPPLPFDDGFFDVIYANSVFTHLDEQRQFEWLQELSRVLVDGGAAVFTVHGETGWKDLEDDELQRAMRRKGFYFKQINTGIRNFAGFPDFYQSAYHSRHYVLQIWARYFDQITYIDAGIDGYQAAVVLRKKSLAESPPAAVAEADDRSQSQ